MHILGIGHSCELGDMYQRLAAEGHEVRVFIRDFAESGVMDGLVQRVDSFRDQLAWVRSAGTDGVIVFEEASDGEAQDALRREGFFVIGGGAFGDRLENDRAFGLSVLADMGLHTAPAHAFDDVRAAITFIRTHPKRYVFKLDGGHAAAWRNFVGQAPDGSDVIALLEGQEARLGAVGISRFSFVLMEHVSGVETGVGAYFNGERFLQPACIDWEHKRFFNDDLGELTGEMGTLVSYRHSERLFSHTLAKLAPRLREHGYVGYINLNTILNDDGIWPLELTCRFGYPGFAILDALQPRGWSALFAALRDPHATHFETRDGFAVGVVLTVPPFPYRYGYAEISKGLPIHFHPPLTPEDQRHVHLGEVALAHGRLVASGVTGYLMVVTGVGLDVPEAQGRAYALARKVLVPNLRYRTDIGDGFTRSHADTLRRLGYLDSP